MSANSGRLGVARAMLALLCAYCVAIGAVAAFASRTFYDDFPFFAHWVNLLPPYNEHLVTDVGELYLGFAILFGWATWKMEPALVRPLCTAWLVPSVLHLGFHAAHLGDFSTADAIGEIVALVLTVVPALIALWASAPPDRTAEP